MKQRDNKSCNKFHQRRYLCKVWELREECSKTHLSIFAVRRSNRQNAFCHLIFHKKALFSELRFGCVLCWFIHVTGLCKVLNVFSDWPGLHLDSTSKTCSDHHPNADKLFVDFGVNQFHSYIFESSVSKYITGRKPFLSYGQTCRW